MSFRVVTNKNIFFGVLIVLSALVAAGLIGVFSHTGSRFLTEFFLGKYLHHTTLNVTTSEGTLASGIVYENLELMDIKGLPEGSEVRIQRLFVNVEGFGIEALEVEIENLRLRLPGQNPIIVSGVLKKGVIKADIYSTSVYLEDIIRLFPGVKLKNDFVASVSELDIQVEGMLEDCKVVGQAILNKVQYENITVSNAPLSFDLNVKKGQGDDILRGKVVVSSGNVKSRKTLVKLDESQFVFEGDPLSPRMRLKGQSRIDGVLIFISLEGLKEDPKVLVSSEPSLPRENLLIMLATGKRWKGVENSLMQQSLSPALVKDFVDYFVFAGRGTQFAEKFGLKDFFVNLEKDRKAIGVKKDISNKIQLGYGVEQRGENQDATVSQKLEGKYRLTDNVSIGVERDLKSMTVDTQREQTIEEDKLQLKYKKAF